ncbi:MAG: glycosyltransferase family 1 protein [Sulfitobacter sp.]|nr:glycosyltransferase family 1 protein [Sulfitobacter sp.]
MSRTLFFDITDILTYLRAESTISGIQRVSFEIIKRTCAQVGKDSVKLTFLDRASGEYLSVPPDVIIEMRDFDPLAFRQFFPEIKGRVVHEHPTLKRYQGKALKYAFHYLKQSHAARTGNEKPFRRVGSSIAVWDEYYGKQKTLQVTPRIPVSKIAKEGDALIVLGATWNTEGWEKRMVQLRDSNRMVVYQLVHDLIPLLLPGHINGDFARQFHTWLTTSMSYCSAYIANSRNTAKDLRSFLDHHGFYPPIKVMPLAQKFTIPEALAGDDLDADLPKDLVKILQIKRETANIAKTPYVLVVGTRESRKNLWRLAVAWQRLVQDETIEMPKLVFAGRSGWLNGDLERLLESTGNLGGWVEIANAPSDAELEFLYENCLFTAMVSLYEGWGLPIGESLSFGKTGVVADNSSMPEVGGDLVEYCKADSIASIASAVRKLVSDPAHREALEARIAATDLRDWDDVTADLIEIVNRDPEDLREESDVA